MAEPTAASRRQQQIAELAELAYEHSPKAKEALDEFAEAQMPGVRARVMAEKHVTAAEARLNAKVQEFDLRVEAEKAARVRESAIGKITTDPTLRIKPDEIPDVEKHMLARGIGNYEDGAHSWRRMNQVAAPVAVHYPTIEVPGLVEAQGVDWLKGVITPGFGVDRDKLDKVTKRQVHTIMTDYANGRGANWE